MDNMKDIPLMKSFPPLRLGVLNGLAAIKDDLGMLDDPDSPYDAETTALLKKLLAPEVRIETVEKEVPVEMQRGRGRPSKDIKLSEEDQQLLTNEITTLISELKDMGSGQGLETSERIQITKTKTNLVDQLLKMRERNTSSQRVEEFIETVIKILEDYMSEKDREAILKRLDTYR